MTDTADQPMGEVERTDAGTRLRFRRHLRHAPDKVWRAITESQHLRHWMPCDIVGERRAGAPLRLPFWPEVAAKYEMAEPTLTGEILAWDPPRLFVWRWDTETLRFELEPTDDGTLLTLTTVVGDVPPAWSAAAGYHACLGQLLLLLDGAELGTVGDLDPTPLEVGYRTLLGA